MGGDWDSEIVRSQTLNTHSHAVLGTDGRLAINKSASLIYMCIRLVTLLLPNAQRRAISLTTPASLYNPSVLLNQNNPWISSVELWVATIPQEYFIFSGNLISPYGNCGLYF